MRGSAKAADPDSDSDKEDNANAEQDFDANAERAEVSLDEGVDLMDLPKRIRSIQSVTFVGPGEVTGARSVTCPNERPTHGRTSLMRSAS